MYIVLFITGFIIGFALSCAGLTGVFKKRYTDTLLSDCTEAMKYGYQQCLMDAHHNLINRPEDIEINMNMAAYELEKLYSTYDER